MPGRMPCGSNRAIQSPQASSASCQTVLQRRHVQRRLRQQHSWQLVHVLQVLQAPRLLRLHPAVFRPPAVKRLRTDPVAAIFRRPHTATGSRKIPTISSPANMLLFIVRLLVTDSRIGRGSPPGAGHGPCLIPAEVGTSCQLPLPTQLAHFRPYALS